MKRVPITQNDYPENFNNVAKYIGRNWTIQKLGLEKSRQLLAIATGYNSIYELEKSFANKLPNIIDTDELLRAVEKKLQDQFKKQYQEENKTVEGGYELWGEFKENIFPKIPLYQIAALNKSLTANVFDGIYDAVAQQLPLYIENYRYGGYYGMFAPGAWNIGNIESAIDYDKTNNLIGFLSDYECFPFGWGNNHISVITQIKDRVDMYFNAQGNWKLEVYDLDDNELSYSAVWDEVLSWFKEASKKSSGTPWYVIDNKKNEKHWLFESLNKAMEVMQDKDLHPEKYIKKDTHIEESQKIVLDGSISLVIDEAHSFTNLFAKTSSIGVKHTVLEQNLKDLKK